MIGLTRPQHDVLRYVAGYIEAKGYPPTLSEIAAATGSDNRSNAFYALRRLDERGTIARGSLTIEILRPVAIPRGPDGEPLFFVRMP